MLSSDSEPHTATNSQEISASVVCGKPGAQDFHAKNAGEK
jgi:hypothetical protein